MNNDVDPPRLRFSRGTPGYRLSTDVDLGDQRAKSEARRRGRAVWELLGQIDGPVFENAVEQASSWI